MDEQTNEAAGGRPKFLSGTTGLIGGLTALVVAVGGLATATKDMWGGDKDAKANMAQESSSEPMTKSKAPTARPTSYKIIGGEGGTLDKVSGTWVWIDAKGTPYKYEQQSDDGTTTIAVLRGYGENGGDIWLRWPNAGGEGLQSWDEGESWKYPVQVMPNASS